jgi:hypothetical protein
MSAKVTLVKKRSMSPLKYKRSTKIYNYTVKDIPRSIQKATVRLVQGCHQRLVKVKVIFSVRER